MDKSKVILGVVFVLAIGGIFGYTFLPKADPPVVQKTTENVVTDTITIETVDFDAIKAKKSKDYVVKISDELVSASAAADAIYFVGAQKESVSKETADEKIIEKKTIVYAVAFKQKDAKTSDVTVAGAKAVLKNKTAVVKVEKPSAEPTPAPAKK